MKLLGNTLFALLLSFAHPLLGVAWIILFLIIDDGQKNPIWKKRRKAYEKSCDYTQPT